MPLSTASTEFGIVLVAVLLIATPIAAIAFARSGDSLKELGKGRFAIDREPAPRPGAAPSPVDPREQESEVRQMVEAASYRRQRRGEQPLDVEAEVARALRLEGAAAGEPADRQDEPESPFDAERELIREEIRTLVVANNERRERRGEEPLDVEAEIQSRMREWGV